MAQFKSYQGRVSTSPRISAASQSADFGGALMDVGQTANAISRDYMDRKADAKLAADRANYKSSVMIMNGEIEQQMNEALANGMDYKDLHEKVVVPAVGKFEADLQNRGYSERGLQEAMNNSQIDAQKAIQGSLGYREQREMQDMLEDNKVGYAMAMDDGDKELADEHLKIIKGIGGNGAANDAKFGYNYGRIQSDLDVMRFGFLNSQYGSADEYISALNDKRKEIADAPLTAGQKYQLDQTIVSRMISAGEAERKQVSDGFKTFQAAVKEGKLEGKTLETVERQIGPENTKMLMDANLKALKKEAPSNASVRDGLDIIGSYTRADGKYKGINQALKAANKIKSNKVKERTMWQLMEMYQERVKDSVEETTPLSTYRSDYLEQIGRMVVAGDKKLGWYDKKMKQFDEWIAANPKAEQEAYFDWRYDQLEADVMEFVQEISAPQQRTQPATEEPDFDNMTDAELEAYIND